ncbi:MAG TPA: ECF-type sigma factor [Bryobacteraceae bacterium]|nr:ECF-type sigma factor [Bryobacteraceae bacterium]
MPENQAVTQLLKEVGKGNQQAVDALIPLVYDQLRRLAARCLIAERPGHTLRATALVHEAYLRLAGADTDWKDRLQFYAVAARTMRRILVDHARTRGRHKRGGGADQVPLDEAIMVGEDPSLDLVDLDQALTDLAEVDARKSQIIEMLFFGGLTTEECAAALDISLSTLHRELKLAKAWLYRALAPTES